MLKIDTSVITATAGYPGLANNSALGTNPGVGLDFLQAEAMQVGEALGLALASDPTKATILSSSPHSGIFIGFATGSGYVYFGGEIFYYPDTILPPVFFGGPTNISATINANPVDTSPNQTVLSDGVTIVSMHNQRTISFAYSYTSNPTGGSGTLPDYGYWIPSQVKVNETNITANTNSITTLNTEFASLTTITPIVVGSGGSAPAYTTGFSGNIKFWKDAVGLVHIWGNLGTPSGYAGDSENAFILPVGYRPAEDMFFASYEDTHGGFVGVAIGGASSGVFTAGGVVLETSIASPGVVGLTLAPFPTI